MHLRAMQRQPRRRETRETQNRGDRANPNDGARRPDKWRLVTRATRLRDDAGQVVDFALRAAERAKAGFDQLASLCAQRQPGTTFEGRGKGSSRMLKRASGRRSPRHANVALERLGRRGRAVPRMHDSAETPPPDSTATSPPPHLLVLAVSQQLHRATLVGREAGHLADDAGDELARGRGPALASRRARLELAQGGLVATAEADGQAWGRRVSARRLQAQPRVEQALSVEHTHRIACLRDRVSSDRAIRPSAPDMMLARVLRARSAAGVEKSRRPRVT